jgi:hypothetical protein
MQGMLMLVMRLVMQLLLVVGRCTAVLQHPSMQPQRGRHGCSMRCIATLVIATAVVAGYVYAVAAQGLPSCCCSSCWALVWRAKHIDAEAAGSSPVSTARRLQVISARLDFQPLPLLLLLLRLLPANKPPPPTLLLLLLLLLFVCSSCEAAGASASSWAAAAAARPAGCLCSALCCALCRSLLRLVVPVCCTSEGLRDAKLVAAPHNDGCKQTRTDVLRDSTHSTGWEER